MPLIQAKQIAGYGTPIETGEIVPVPEGVMTGTQAVHALNDNYDGGSMVLRRAASMSRIIFRLTSVTVNARPRVLIYQTTDGGSGVASLKASATAAALAAGAQDVTLVFNEGTVNFAPGLIYVLFGRFVAIGASLRVYTSSAFDLLNTGVDPNTHPLCFSTAIAASGAAPATFNPLTAPTAASTDLVPVIRLRA